MAKEKEAPKDKPVEKKSKSSLGILLKKPVKFVHNGFVIEMPPGEHKFKGTYPKPIWEKAVKHLKKGDYRWL